MPIDLEGLAALVGAAATLAATLGALRWQDRRPTRTDQGRAYRSVQRAASRATKQRARYDASVRELDHARAVAYAVDARRPEREQPEDEDLVLATGEALVEQMELHAGRMEDAVAAFAELVTRHGAQTARAVASITGQQPAVARAAAPARPPASPPPPAPVSVQALLGEKDDVEDETPRPAPAFGSWRRPEPTEDHPETGPLGTFDQLWQGPGSAYRPPRERGER